MCFTFIFMFIFIYDFPIWRRPICREALYNSPGNKSKIANNDQICAKAIQNTLNPELYHIKCDEK